MSYLIKDTTKEEREKIVADSLGNLYGYCDGCAVGVAEMYQDYIDGKRELREINMAFRNRDEISYDDLTEALLRKACFVIDFLPRRVPEESPGQFWRVEQFFLSDELFRKFINILLKLNCYHDFAVWHDEEWLENPGPEDLAAWIRQPKGVCIIVKQENVLITVNGTDTHMTVYDPDTETLKMLRELSAAEGLFVREGMN